MHLTREDLWIREVYKPSGHNDEDGDKDGDGDNGGNNGDGSSGDNSDCDQEDEHCDGEQNDYRILLFKFNPCVVQVLSEIHTLSMLSDDHHHCWNFPQAEASPGSCR